MIELYPEFYNDVFGPIMQPGSSSHMAAPCRAGYLCNSILGEEVAEILEGNTCGMRSTSCADQLSRAIKEVL